MNMNMTIDQIKVERDLLEANILAAVNRFEELTTMQVTQVMLRSDYMIGRRNQTTIFVDVEVKL